MKKRFPFHWLFALTFCLLCSPAAQAITYFRWGEMPVKEVQGQTKIFDDGHGNSFLEYTPTKVGDAISFSITIPRSGNYRMQTTSYKTGNEGIYQWEIDDAKTGSFDFYLSNVWEHGVFYVDAGTYTVTYRCTGKNDKSPGLGVSLGRLRLNPTGR